MNRLSEGTPRRWPSAHAAVSGWLFVLLTLVACCSLTPSAPSEHRTTADAVSVSQHSAAHTLAAVPAVAAEHPVTDRTVVADAPDDRGAGSSCHGATEHAAPVVQPGQAAPVALPGTAVTSPVAPLSGGAAIRGPSNDAAQDVDHLRLQVQRV
ncbi:hypothetical protein AB0L71_13100 [Streptomyces sp. NPDC052052]|uniref:hypothetical protein n=1 Tax=Streptomyces sp. NPDC052052 TaxID=3154756 RepID=UPI003419AD59